MTDPLEAIVAELYGLAPGEFTAARNGYAKQLRDEGDRELSDRVKVLRKPAAAAWVVNLLVRHHSAEMASVLELGESLRQAQTDLDGDALRELGRQRRRLIAAVAVAGRVLARERGQRVSESVVRQVEDTLHAAMIDTDAASAVRTGLLVDPLSATGVGSLKVASAVADHTALGSSVRPLSVVAGPAGARAAAPTELHAVPGPDAEERARREAEELAQRRQEAAASVAAAEADLERSRADLAANERAVQDLQAQCLQVNGEIDELRRRIDELEDRLEQLDDASDSARAERDEAAEHVALAESALAEARAVADGLPG